MADNVAKYKKYFTKDHLMGPNSFRLLDELIRRSPRGVRFDRTLDLGCGYALTSLFLANETNAKYVYAFDLWIPASENYVRIRDCGLEDKVIPIHGDAMDMPFAHGYFDAIVSVDAYHYFGCKSGVFSEKILPFVKENGYVMIAMGRLACKQENEEITTHCYQQSPSDKGFNQRWNEMKTAPTGSQARTPRKGQSEGSFEASRLSSVSWKCRS